MSKLEPNEQNYLRSLTKGFTPEEMAEVYNNAHRKGYFELMEAATRIKEKKEGNVPDTQAPREAATPIAMGELSTGGAAEIFKSAGRLIVKKERDIIDLTSDDEDPDSTQAAPETETVTGTDDFTFPPTKSTIKAGPGSQDAIYVRYHRLAKSFVSFQLEDKSTKADLIRHCWAIEQNVADLESRFPSTNRLRNFIKKNHDALTKHNPRVARVLLATNVSPSADSSTHVPKKRRRRKSESSAESSGLSSLESDDSDNGNPHEQHIKRSKGISRVERIAGYGKTYQGYNSGIKQHFYQWVVAQEVVAKSGSKKVVDIFTTVDAVKNFLARYQLDIDMSQSPKMAALLYGSNGFGSVTAVRDSAGRGDSPKSTGIVDQQL